MVNNIENSVKDIKQPRWYYPAFSLALVLITSFILILDYEVSIELYIFMSIAIFGFCGWTISAIKYENLKHKLQNS